MTSFSVHSRLEALGEFSKATYSYVIDKTLNKEVNSMRYGLPLVTLFLATAPPLYAHGQHSLKVKASAYTSSVGETDSTPNIGAWGDTLKPGMKSIAVSRDLLDMGLTHNTEVRIKGLSGTYRVLDKMNKRWTKKIDIYMGNDVNKAKQWGVRTVTIHWDGN
ncbi:3D domain-containing protein [Vibrio astriarenae]